MFKSVKAVIDITRKTCRSTKNHDNTTLMMLNMLTKKEAYSAPDKVYAIEFN